MSALSTILVALIVSVIAPAIVGFITASQRRADKKQDWDRQDQVAANAAAAAAAAQAAAAAAQVTADKVVTAAQTTDDKLNVIHGLVNSSMTAALQAELTATLALRTSMMENIELRKTANLPPILNAVGLVELDSHIAELEHTLAERIKAQGTDPSPFFPLPPS